MIDILCIPIHIYVCVYINITPLRQTTLNNAETYSHPNRTRGIIYGN